MLYRYCFLKGILLILSYEIMLFTLFCDVVLFPLTENDNAPLHPPPRYDYVTAASAPQPSVTISQPQYGQQQGQFVYYQPGQQPMTAASMEERPNDCLAYAIFTCLCCFWPLGIVALIRSIQCRSAISHGNMVEAQRMSKQTKGFAHAALICGIIFTIIYIILRVVVVQG